MATAVLDTIYDNINKPDTDLNMVIQAYLDGQYYYGDSMTAAQWRIFRYDWLRQMLYPDRTIPLDAGVKISSPDPDTQAEGQTQLDQYNTDCLVVKTRFPKE